MRKWVLVGSALIASLTGCVTAMTLNRDVTGPHGEHLMEISCGLPDQCMSYGRQVCGGDFDILHSSDSVSGSRAGTTSSDVMLIQCKNEPQSAQPQ